MALADREIAHECGYLWDEENKVFVSDNALMRQWLTKDNSIVALEKPMIEPFYPFQVSERILDHESLDTEKVISYGLSSFGYDARLGNEIYVMKEPSGILHTMADMVLDPKKPNPDHFHKYNLKDGESFVLAPGGFALSTTKEYFRIPRDCVVVCLGKSTYARNALVVNVTPLEPEWEGEVTLELSNTGTLPIRIYVGEGICQFLFEDSENDCARSYADKKGKYQGQRGVTLGRA